MTCVPGISTTLDVYGDLSPTQLYSMAQSALPPSRNDGENKKRPLTSSAEVRESSQQHSNTARLATINGAALSSISSATGQKYLFLEELAEPKAMSAVAVLRSRLRYSIGQY